jgi:hypothetical protein
MRPVDVFASGATGTTSAIARPKVIRETLIPAEQIPFFRKSRRFIFTIVLDSAIVETARTALSTQIALPSHGIGLTKRMQMR